MHNLALNKPALQSSTSDWSGSQVRAEDARGANNGDLSCDVGFHTATETDPWWQVDLEDDFLIRKVVIFNRRHCAHRLRHFSILKSLDGLTWNVIFRKVDAVVFGETNDLPYTAEIIGNQLARFVRVRLDGLECLHFRECEVIGLRPDLDTRERAIREEACVDRMRMMTPPGRTGEMVAIGGFTVFLDADNYSPLIAHALRNGGYEDRERQLVRQAVLPNDRVIEVGTAIGVVSMTAAAIVSASNVRTFDANPDFVADAQENFRRNGLVGIQSRLGVLRNRRLANNTGKTVDFYIDEAFWASRLNASITDPGIVRVVEVPVFVLEDEIKSHNANVLICDIEGGEVELLTQADLSGIRLIIMETHYWSVGEAATDAMIRKLILTGFFLHLGLSGHQVIMLRRQA